MAECPFCAGEVSEDLITFGGPCPKCFAEIPGEEAPTDPGEEVRQAQARKDHQRAAFRAMIPIALAFPVVACLGLGAAFTMLWPEPEVVVMDFDQLEDWPEPELVAYEHGEEAASEPEPRAARSPRPSSDPRRAAERYAGGEGLEAGGSPELRDDGVAAVDEPGIRGSSGTAEGPATIGGASSPGSKRSGLSFGLDVNTRRDGGVLTDVDQIRQMIGGQMREQVPKLNQCYERQLKTNPGLSGRWRISYTVTTEGRAADASATGLNVQNAEFEACLSSAIERWRFDRIAMNQPVKRTLKFVPR